MKAPIATGVWEYVCLVDKPQGLTTHGGYGYVCSKTAVAENSKVVKFDLATGGVAVFGEYFT